MSQQAEATDVAAERTLLGIPVNQLPIAALVARAVRAIDEPAEAPFTFACANPHSLVVARRDAYFRQCLRSCSAVVADGIGVQVAGLISGGQFGPRITGWDFFHATMGELDRRGGKAFFFGSRAEVLELLRNRAAGDYPGVRIETLSPPYGDWTEAENEAMLERIRSFAPDALWIGMTAPRQEKWMHANALLAKVPVVGAIGAVFDYYAGTVKRAPAWVCEAGMEWLYRLAGEPGRLWKRTVVSAPQFLWLVARERFMPQPDADVETIAPAQ
jgi:N-acetylglucosaminyldiphosphoundecaprenol N-acetyl-beta-D-mannosaminyltransferase